MLDAVDHVSQSMPYDEMLSWLLFYTGILDLERLPQMEIADPVGLVQSQALINGNENLRVVLNGSSATRTLSSRFIHVVEPASKAEQVDAIMRHRQP